MGEGMSKTFAASEYLTTGDILYPYELRHTFAGLRPQLMRYLLTVLLVFTAKR